MYHSTHKKMPQSGLRSVFEQALSPLTRFACCFWPDLCKIPHFAETERLQTHCTPATVCSLLVYLLNPASLRAVRAQPWPPNPAPSLRTASCLARRNQAPTGGPLVDEHMSVCVVTAACCSNSRAQVQLPDHSCIC